MGWGERLKDLTQEVHDFVTMDAEELLKSARELAKVKEGSSQLRPEIVSAKCKR